MNRGAFNEVGAKASFSGYLLWGSAKIALVYLAFASLWILLSDSSLLALAGEQGFRQLSPYKGIFFVSVTSLMLFLLVSRYVSKLEEERQSLEDAIRRQKAAEARQLDILNSIPGYIYVKDKDFRYTYANKAVCDLTGNTQESVIGKTDKDLFDEKTAAALKATDAEVLVEGHKVLREEVNTLAPGKQPIVFMSTKIPLYDLKGEICGLCGISTDVTSTFHQRQALAESEARLRLAVSASKLVVLEYDPKTNLLLRSGLCEEVLGLPEGKSDLQDFVSLIHAEDRQDFTDAVYRAVSTSAPIELELALTKGDEEITFRLAGSTEVREDGSQVLLCVGRDVTEIIKHQLELEQGRLRRSALFENSVDGIVILDVAGTVIEVNESFSRMLDISADHLIGKPIANWFKELSPEELRKHGLAETKRFQFETKWLIPDIGLADIEVKVLLGEIEHENIYICTCRDVTVSNAYEESLRQSESQFRTLIESSPNGIMLIDDLGMVRQVNSETERLLGYSREELLERSAEEILLGDSADRQVGIFDHYWFDLRSVDFGDSREIVTRSKSGESLHLEVGLTRISDSSGRNMSLATLVDASHRFKSQEQIRKLAFYDELTGLPNRYSMIITLDRMVQAASDSGEKFGLLLLDLDRFRDINDSYGQGVGDTVLRMAAERIKSAVQDSYLLARVGGDDFALLLWTSPGETLNLSEKANRILEAFSEPMAVDGVQLFTTVGVGGCTCPDDGTTIQKLFGCLETSLFEAKRLGRGQFVQYANELGEKARAQHAVELDLRHALIRDEFVLFYQPIINLVTGKICGAEALLRWNHPERGLLPPAAFIDACEATNLIVPVGRWVLMEACRQAKQWQESHMPSLKISVNFSAKQFADAQLIEDVKHAVRHTKISDGTLQVEITESQLMDDPEAAGVILKHLKAMGVQLAIDDFGTGYSSFNRLKSFPIDCLKIDRSFIRNVFEDNASRAICRSIIVLGRNLNLSVVAEGVETLEQEAFLKDLDCEYSQGYFRGRPVSAEEFEKLLIES